MCHSGSTEPSSVLTRRSSSTISSGSEPEKSTSPTMSVTSSNARVAGAIQNENVLAGGTGCTHRTM
ncbi:hypothetical protein ACFV5N_00600 [Streptomyces sp. NPDC059853]|uniref:hypothetical protein n=1 Tax=Streptomyces sp. NPDC059853 TaxID=3346973 RepID=UPI00364E7473